MSFDPITAVLSIGEKIIDKLWPDPIQAAQKKLELVQLNQAGNLEELRISMSAILAEAQSADKWTSRARPSFLYVMYAMILFAIPMGILSVFKPDMAIQIAVGMQAWLKAIPDALWAVFGVGYTGYTVARSVWDKQVTPAK